ncbi:MAG: hypothetical protein C0483_25560 [Pirellula sp.]|nr:hypothetical protein [Pirellula sp.]
MIAAVARGSHLTDFEEYMAIRVPCCPHCPHSRITPSRVRWYEVPLLAILRRPFRCKTCGIRFFGQMRMIDLPHWFERSA